MASTATVTSVAQNVASVVLLASLSSRLGFRVFNDATADCYVKFGATASATSFTAMLEPGGYLEEDSYYGGVDALWASAGAGSARITSLT